MDENDNVPIFQNAVWEKTITINDDVKINDILLKINATDSDSGLNGKIRYKLILDKSGSMDLNPDTGELVFARYLKQIETFTKSTFREVNFIDSEFFITISAEDSGETKVLSAEKQFKILWYRTIVKAGNFNSMHFLREKYTAVVMEGQPKGQFVAQVCRLIYFYLIGIKVLIIF